MNWMTDIQMVSGVILSAWGVIALILGPIAFIKARKYFPERREAISPDQLRTELATVDHANREAFQREISGLGARVTDMKVEIIAELKALESRTDEALEKSQTALHEVEILRERMTGMDRVVMEKLDNLKGMLRRRRQEETTK